MNAVEINTILQNLNPVNEQQTADLEKIVQEFPYFQSVRAFYLKGLFQENSFKYNFELKKTAAHTTDRSVLFDFITNQDFSTIQQESENKILDIDVENSFEVPAYKIEQSILKTIKVSDSEIEQNTIITQPEINEIEEKLEIGKPLEFNSAEKHSFQEWLQLSKTKPIERENNQQTNISSEEIEKQKKNNLIDKFIENNPKIPKIKDKKTENAFIFEPSQADNSFLMTETLARVYLEQHKYQKAIQAYDILILKYPEKSSFFADRILDIKNLQQNNTQS